jgi:hypothetical protein
MHDAEACVGQRQAESVAPAPSSRGGQVGTLSRNTRAVIATNGNACAA